MTKGTHYIAIAFSVICFLFSPDSTANNITVSTVSLTARNKTADYVQVQFNLSWNNSFRVSTGPSNWDAAWVFIKFKVGANGDWKHASISTTGGHSIPSGATASQDDTKGLFIYRDAIETGTLSLTGVQLRWNYGVDGVGDDEKIYVKVFAIEMVLVPRGDFTVGSGGQNTGEFRQANDVSTSGPATTFTVTSTAPTFQGNNTGSSSANLSTRAGAGNDLLSGTTTAALGVGYPTGYGDFYCMKYEISQGQYRDFLNTLTYSQQETRTANLPNSLAGTGALISSGTARNGIEIKTAGTASTIPAEYGCDLSNNNVYNEAADGEWIACNYLSWNDVAAYLDWAALRPMTELEYEKACRGTLPPVVNEYAWGNATATSLSSLLNSSESSEASNTSGANLAGNNTLGGPVRVGLFATGSSNRIQAGSSYYGIMELSGNLWEQTVPISNSNARGFSNVMGDGTLTSSGNANVSTWPITSDMGIRGGSYTSIGSLNYLSDRSNINSTVANRNNNIGGRGVRKIVIAKVEYLIVGGGGGGGNCNTGAFWGTGGGGGGGVLTGTTNVTTQSYSITVGAGGGSNTNGGNSVFNSLTALGGGYGGNASGLPNRVGGNGGSGGGGGGYGVLGGTGTSGQGNNGGTGVNDFGGGGGGAGAAGSNSSGGAGGNGGNGIQSAISGSNTFYGGGGGGGYQSSTGGLGGGGNINVSGTNGLGGGGGGGAGTSTPGASGGSGVVIIRYKTDGSDGVSNSSTGGTKTTSGLYTIHTFTSSGTFVCVLSN